MKRFSVYIQRLETRRQCEKDSWFVFTKANHWVGIFVLISPFVSICKRLQFLLLKTGFRVLGQRGLLTSELELLKKCIPLTTDEFQRTSRIRVARKRHELHHRQRTKLGYMDDLKAVAVWRSPIFHSDCGSVKGQPHRKRFPSLQKLMTMCLSLIKLCILCTKWYGARVQLMLTT